MKKVLLVLLLGVLTGSAQAQDPVKLPPALGVKGGVNYSRFAFTPDVDQQLLLGYTGGLVFKHFSTPNIGIQVELNYVQGGWKAIQNQDSSYTRSLDYIELPFLTHVALGDRNTRFILNLGPYVSYQLRDNGTDAPAGETPTGYQYKSIDNEFVYGLGFGIGMMQKTAMGTLQLEGRFTHGLRDVFSREIDLTSSKSQNISVTLSYLLSFGAGKGQE
ncbi:porin family protein [Pontibacter anaerobius]|uniref:Porin family protein n=1 Tax=Pontibacter anaerobius TaxID=2993940 RepID=A0ABT3RDI3_9BACT|nr:porin family protein [Pontibacter anaerobius]MCX2739432.1 porin family protein [Pontibacter anaerobius]